jgi:IclR family acetate operon transcriptional repressor
MANDIRVATRGSNGEGASVEAVDRAARVLFAMAARPIPSTLAEIAQRADLTKPTAFRILASLIAEGLAAQNAQTGSYRLGSTPLRLAASVLRNVAVREPALAAMRKIRDDVNETVVLSVREGDLRYNIDSVEAVNAIAQAHQIGVAIPLYAGAASRVLLAGMESEELLSYLGHTDLVAYSETTIIDRETLIAELKVARRQGYAASSGEFTSAGHAVAIAIRDADGRAIAALHVSVPRSRFSQVVEDRCAAALREAVASIETAMATKAA